MNVFARRGYGRRKDSCGAAVMLQHGEAQHGVVGRRSTDLEPELHRVPLLNSLVQVSQVLPREPRG